MGYRHFLGKGVIVVNAEWTLWALAMLPGDKEVSWTGACVIRSEGRERRIHELLLSESCPQVPDRVWVTSLVPVQQGLRGRSTKLGLAAALFNHVDPGLVGAHLKCWRGIEAETSFWTGDSPGIEKQNYESSQS